MKSFVTGMSSARSSSATHGCAESIRATHSAIARSAFPARAANSSPARSVHCGASFEISPRSAARDWTSSSRAATHIRLARPSRGMCPTSFRTSSAIFSNVMPA